MYVLANSINNLMNHCSELSNVGNCAINGDNITKAAFQTTTYGFTGPIRFSQSGDRAMDSMHSIF